MNTAQLSSISPVKSPALMAKDLKEDRKPDMKAGESQVKTAKTPKKDKGAESVDTKSASLTPKEKQSKEVQDYLKVINRLEQSLVSKKIEPEELEKSLKNLEEKLAALKPEQKKKLLGMEFFVKNKIENLKSLKDQLNTALLDEQERTDALALLKDKQFIALLHNLPGTLDSTYNQTAKANQAQPISTREIKA